MTIRKRSNAISKTAIAHSKSLESSSCLEFVVRHKFALAFVIRSSSVLMTKTFFVPDEYWQSTEIAHYSTFKYGYITWEWKEMIRSYLYPFIFELYFRVLKVSNVDFTCAVVSGPHLIQALITTYSDVSVYYVCLKICHDSSIAALSFSLQLSSWFIFYTGSRTLSNTAEMCFTCIGLSFFPFSSLSDVDLEYHRKNSLFLSLLFGGIACIIRPTSLIIWGVLLLTSILSRTGFLFNLFTSALKVFPLLAILLFGIDYYYYQQFVFVHWNFMKFNVLENLSGFYGSHPFHWYITVGLPVVLTVHTIYVVVGLFHTKKVTVFIWIIMSYVMIHSLIAHKEFRFLLPIMPLLMCHAGQGMQMLCKLFKCKQTRVLMITVLINALPAVYFSMYHQKGVIDALNLIRMDATWDKKMSVLYLMPCHSTPYHSYIHSNISMKFLTCHPNKSSGYVEEAEQFYADPVQWLKTEVLHNKMYCPTHIVSFDVLPQVGKDMLVTSGYDKVASFFHSHFPEGRIGAYVDIYKNM